MVRAFSMTLMSTQRKIPQLQSVPTAGCFFFYR